MSNINISKQSEKMTCTICCDSENISNTLCNCSGEICVKCINKIITLRKEYFLFKMKFET